MTEPIPIISVPSLAYPHIRSTAPIQFLASTVVEVAPRIVAIVLAIVVAVIADKIGLINVDINQHILYSS
jgi:hypothetical protein